MNNYKKLTFNNIMDTINVLYNPNNCLARLKNNLKQQCTCKKKQNSLFCGIHMKCSNVYRIDLPEQDILTSFPIRKKKKTLIKLTDLLKYNRLKSFNILDLKYTFDFYKLKGEFNLTLEDESLLVLKLTQFLTQLEYYKNNIKPIIKCQAIIRGFITRKLNRLRGPALFKRTLSNNDTDFLTYSPIHKIDIKDFFSYSDSDEFIYSFTIKSLNYIINTTKLNPYNRKEIPHSSIENIKTILKLNNTDLTIKFDLPTDKNSLIKQKCIKIFQRMDDLKLYTQPRWFLDLDVIKLKKLYSETEDIWNYRTMLTPDQKKKYTKSGTAFTYSVSKMNKLEDKYLLQNIILTEYEKFAFEGETPDDCITSCYWILMGLSIVSENAAEGMPELVHSQVIH